MQKHDAKKIYKLVREKNRILNQWEQYYRKDALESYPLIINIPTGSRCNVKCKFCTDRQGEKANAEYKDFTMEGFLSTFENESWQQAFMRSKTIALYGWGEPLFNLDYEKIFDYVTRNFPGLGINISTNGILFSHKWSEKIVAIDDSEINFSVNAATKETYYKLIGSNQFERVIANIRSLTGLRDECRTKNPYVALSYVATIENISELPQFVNLAADLKADSILVQDVVLLNESTEKLSLTNEPELACTMFKIAEEEAKKRKISFFSFVTNQVDYFLKDSDAGTYDYPCLQSNIVESDRPPSPYFANTDCFDPWERFMVSENGEVFPCCRYQTSPEFALGNVYKQKFQDIWNGYAYRSLRKMINTNNPPSACAICPRKAGLD